MPTITNNKILSKYRRSFRENEVMLTLCIVYDSLKSNLQQSLYLRTSDFTRLFST